MNIEDLIDKLIEYFVIEDRSLEQFELPEEVEDKREFLDNRIALREPNELDETILEMEDMLLQKELEQKDIVDISEIETVDITLQNDDAFSNVIALWQGDISCLKTDCIVNAANPSLLGCSLPNHKCIDRVIHSNAGIRLKLECYDIMKNQMHNENIGSAKITSGYNLPAKYVIHTVGPTVYGELTNENKEDLAKCYYQVLKLAKNKNIRTIAIPCISTGEYHFPKNEAAIIALDTIREFLSENNNSFDKIIINVYTNEDYNAYKKLL